MADEAVSCVLPGVALDTLTIGVAITDAHARLLYANATADRLMRQASGGLTVNAGKVIASCQDTRAGLSTLISQVCAAGSAAAPERSVAPDSYLFVPSPDRASPNLAVCIRSIDTAGSVYAMIVVRPIERACNLEAEAQCLLGLSRAEARLASGLAAGLSIQEAADAQGVTLATARSHLKSIFRKTGLKRQSQIVALLRSTQMPLEAPCRQHPHRKKSQSAEKARTLHLSA